MIYSPIVWLASRGNSYVLAGLIALLVMVVVVPARGESTDFKNKDALTGWETTGDVSIDAEKKREGGEASLKIAPGASVRKKLSDKAVAGKVSFWVYDDGTKPENPKAKSAGPRWGIAQSDGAALVVGHIYAPYLSGDTTYATSESKVGATAAEWVGKVQYLGEKRKADGWQKWTFNFDADKGLSLLVNDKPIKRFDWNTSKIAGMSEIIIFGDSAKAGGQTIWVSNVESEVGGDMKAQPVAPPPPPPVVPDKDPEPTNKIELRAGMAGVHPRLLFTEKEIPALRQRYKDDAVARERLEKYVAACKPFSEPKFLTDATDGQRQGLWQMPTLAMHYALTDSADSRDKAIGFLQKLVELPNWETGSELDSGMSSANVLIGAAMTYDILYHQIPADLRDKVAAKLLLQARKQIHGGHLMKNPGVHYWQNDPANNHRWHRNAGMAMALMAVYEGQPEAQWAVEFMVKELTFIHKWLPLDGSNHEGPGYLIFGLPHLVLSFEASDNVLGTKFMEHEYFAKAPWFLTQAMMPGLGDFMPYGDTGGMGFYFGPLYAGPSARGDAAAIAAIDKIRKENPNAFAYSWMDLVWRDGTLLKSDTNYDLAKVGRYEDLGITFIRDSWNDNAVAAMFKCGPLGGVELNKFREETTPFGYINVAHCDPDANTFIIAMGKELVAETSRYSGHKLSSSHNTILINGAGQYAEGRKEGEVWSQPASGNNSMLDDAQVITWKQIDPKTLLIEGEAAGSYPAKRGERPQIERFRRTFLWKEGSYILVLDDVRSPEAVDVTWLMQGPKLAEKGDGYELTSGAANCLFKVVSDVKLQTKIGVSTADNKKKVLGWQQLQATTGPTKAVRFASAYAPWGGDISVSLDAKVDAATVVVKYAKGEDRYTWTYAKDAKSASTLEQTK